MPDKTDKINIVTPQGNVIQGTREELDRLQVLGDYREEGAESNITRNIKRQKEKDYSSVRQQVLTAVEGGLSGATLGGSDLLLGDAESANRAEVNPGTRLASEIVGGVLPALVPGGQFTPAGALSRGAGAASKAVGGGFKGAAVAGAIEGAGAGLQADISNATISNDPITVNSLLGGIGYGALFGSALNAGIHGVGAGAERLGNKLEVKPQYETKFTDKTDIIEVVGQDNYDVFRKNIIDTRDGIIPNPEFVARQAEIKSLEDEMARIDSSYRLSKEAGAVNQADVDATLELLDDAFTWIQTKNKLDKLKARPPIPETTTPSGIVDNYISKVDEEIDILNKDHAGALANLDDEIAAKKKAARDLSKKIPEAKIEHTNKLIAANNERAFAQRELDKFSDDAEEAIGLSQKQYQKEVESGGLYSSSVELENTYNSIFEKLGTKAVDNEYVSQASVLIKKRLGDYKKFVKAGDYKAAHGALKEAKGYMDVLGKYTNTAVPDIKVSVKASPKKVAEYYNNIAGLEERLASAENKLSELKARGPRNYAAEVKATEDEVNYLLKTKKEFPPVDSTEWVGIKKELIKTKRALEMVRDFPSTASEFRKMNTARVNELGDALDHVLKVSKGIPELEPVVASLEKATRSLVDSTGIKAEGSIVEQLKAIQRVAKEANKHKIVTTIEEEVLKSSKRSRGGVAGFGSDLGAGFAASAATKAVGVTGLMPYMAVKHALLSGVEGLAGIKSAVQNRVSKAAKAVGKTFKSSNKNYVVPKLVPLYTKLNGGRDKDAKNPRQAATNRINELVEMAPVAPDVLYKSLEPLAGTVHNDVISALHASAVAGYNALLELLPKNRIGTQTAFKQTWEANDIETAITGKLLDVFYDPVGTIEEAVTGAVDPIKVMALKEIWPPMYAQLQSDLIQAIADNPHLLDSYNNQQAFSTLVGIKTSTSFTPENIREAQDIFVATPNVPQTSQGGGSRNNSGGGRSPKMEPPTAAQSLIGMA